MYWVPRHHLSANKTQKTESGPGMCKKETQAAEPAWWPRLGRAAHAIYSFTRRPQDSDRCCHVASECKMGRDELDEVKDARILVGASTSLLRLTIRKLCMVGTVAGCSRPTSAMVITLHCRTSGRASRTCRTIISRTDAGYVFRCTRQLSTPRRMISSSSSSSVSSSPKMPAMRSSMSGSYSILTIIFMRLRLAVENWFSFKDEISMAMTFRMCLPSTFTADEKVASTPGSRVLSMCTMDGMEADDSRPSSPSNSMAWIFTLPFSKKRDSRLSTFDWCSRAMALCMRSSFRISFFSRVSSSFSSPITLPMFSRMCAVDMRDTQRRHATRMASSSSFSSGVSSGRLW
mmetsp:Transcript_52291/g.131312  ORF Transcript_52291/g.131312 Transcript_52291/m.131312 type:complete len:346 (+) Transcript_52291:140-1177(+)